MSGQQRGSIPGRTPGVISRPVGDEFVVIHPETNTAHSLSGLHAQVWRATAGDGAALPDLTAAELDVVLSELRALGLVEPTGLSRRALLNKAGAAGGLVVAANFAVAAAPSGIASLILPDAAAASSRDVNKTDAGTFSVVGVRGATRIDFTLTGAGGGGRGNSLGGRGVQVTGVILIPGGLPASTTISGTVGAGGLGAGATPTRNGGTDALGGDSPVINSGPFGGGGGGGGTSLRIGGTLVALAGGGGGAGIAPGALLSGAGGNAGLTFAVGVAPGSNGGVGNGTNNGGAGGAGTTAAGSGGAAAGTGGGGGGNASGQNGGVGGGAASPGQIKGGGGGGGYFGAGGGGAGSSGGNNANNANANSTGGGGGGGSSFVALSGTYIVTGTTASLAGTAATTGNPGSTGSAIVQFS